MTRLMRTLTVVLGVLILLGGGSVLVIHASRSSAPALASVGASSPATPTTVGAVTAGDGTTAPPTSRLGTTTVPPPPTTPTTLSPLATLTTGLDTALAGTNSCLTVTDGGGRVLYQHQGDTPLTPASTQKLLVASAALTTLGPNYRFVTKVVAPTPPVAGQVPALWLVGGGDPLLASPEFMAANAARARQAGYPWTPLAGLSDALAAAGIKSVPGGIRGDDSYEDRLRFLPVWPAIYQQQDQIGLLSALSVNEGVQFTPPKSPLAPDPPAYAASELARLLTAHQPAGTPPVAGGPDQAAPAAAVVVASVPSAPVYQIVEAMLRASDNWIAELLVRAIDKASGGAGTTAGGTAVVLHDAAAAGIPLNGVQMDDGSGLSHTDRATCRELLAALDLGRQPPFAPILAGLAVAGQTGTLATRYQGTPLAGQLRAKTGSLDNAIGMVGTLSGPTPVQFAFLENDALSETALYAREDAVAAAVGTYARSG
ncbi:MAG TPA: D-alanyl-D-alanine carboxypeptidase [Acidimicrobiales bacterium]|nr:D-alanyl-D-alanine carboxypeptidase [Acidimicrobiales bacterium]